jgi:hypothetical protein
MITRGPCRFWKASAPLSLFIVVESVWNAMAHGDAQEGKWRGNRRMEWVGSALPLYLGTRSIQLIQSLPADLHSSSASTQLNWLPHRFKWTRPFPWKTKSGFCACAIMFQMNFTSSITSKEELGSEISEVCFVVNMKVIVFILRLYWECEWQWSSQVPLKRSLPTELHDI